MTTCTIIISHYESLPFLRACVRQIRKYKHLKIDQNIIICDQSSSETYIDLCAEFEGDADIFIVHTAPHYSGFGIDSVLRYVPIRTKYICQVHADIVPISKNWLYLPIKLIVEYNFAFVGQLHFININSPVYPPNPFFSMSPTFNVARTETYKEMSLQAGFTRYHEREKIDMKFKNKDWDKWAAEDYANRGSDDDTVAFHWEDTHREHDKLGLAITGMIAAPYGRIIEDIVFHFGSCRESIGVDMGAEYNRFTQRINAGYDDALIEEMVSLAKANKPPAAQILTRNFWDGKLKESMPPFEKLNNRIEELKNIQNDTKRKKRISPKET